MVKDLVCGKEIDETQWDAPGTLIRRWVYEEKDYFFCGLGCRAKFIANADQYKGKP